MTRPPCQQLVESVKLRWSTSTLPWSISGQDIAGGPSLDPPRSSGDTGPFWVTSMVEDEGLLAICLASATGVPASPRRGSERLGAGDTSKDRRRSIGAAGSARVGTSGEIKIGHGALVNC